MFFESSLHIEVKLLRDRSTTARKKTRFHKDTRDENVNEMNAKAESPEEAHFRKHILYVVLDNVIEGLTVPCSVQENRFLIPSAFFGTTKMKMKNENV